MLCQSSLLSTVIKPGLHIVVMAVSTVANMFLTLVQAVLIQVNTLAKVKLTHIIGPTMCVDKS